MKILDVCLFKMTLLFQDQFPLAFFFKKSFPHWLSWTHSLWDTNTFPMRVSHSVLGEASKCPGPLVKGMLILDRGMLTPVKRGSGHGRCPAGWCQPWPWSFEGLSSTAVRWSVYMVWLQGQGSLWTLFRLLPLYYGRKSKLLISKSIVWESKGI